MVGACFQSRHSAWLGLELVQSWASFLVIHLFHRFMFGSSGFLWRQQETSPVLSTIPWQWQVMSNLPSALYLIIVVFSGISCNLVPLFCRMGIQVYILPVSDTWILRCYYWNTKQIPILLTRKVKMCYISPALPVCMISHKLFASTAVMFIYLTR